jgi:hypothetical protein
VRLYAFWRGRSTTNQIIFLFSGDAERIGGGRDKRDAEGTEEAQRSRRVGGEEGREGHRGGAEVAGE